MSKEEAPAEGEAPKKKGKLLIIIGIVVGVVVLAAGGIAAWLLTSAPDKSKKDKGDEEAAADEEGGHGDGQDGEEHPPVYEKLEQFTVNLADQETYLQTEIQLLVADPAVQEKLKQRMPEVRDALIRLLSSKTPEELSQPDGKTKLADEVQEELNGLLGAKKASKGVKKVLFGAFIIQ
ncbi:MAG: flagellar basal body-associated FliL family protein [Pseudomonadota bacterium]